MEPVFGPLNCTGGKMQPLFLVYCFRVSIAVFVNHLGVKVFHISPLINLAASNCKDDFRFAFDLTSVSDWSVCWTQDSFFFFSFC